MYFIYLYINDYKYKKKIIIIIILAPLKLGSRLLVLAVDDA